MIEERAQARIVVFAEARMGTERIRHLGQRLAEMLLQHLLVGHVVRHFAQTIHVVGKSDQVRLHLVIGKNTKGMPHHGRAGDLAKGANMRQTGRPVAGLEDYFVLGMFLKPRDDLARLLERPGIRLLGKLT